MEPGHPAGDPQEKVAYDPFATGQVRGGLGAGLERVRQSMAEGRVARGVSVLDTATLAETEGKAALHQAAMKVLGRGEAAETYDTVYGTAYGRLHGAEAYGRIYDDILGRGEYSARREKVALAREEYARERRLAGRIDQAMRSDASPEDMRRGNQALDALNDYGLVLCHPCFVRLVDAKTFNKQKVMALNTRQSIRD